MPPRLPEDPIQRPVAVLARSAARFARDLDVWLQRPGSVRGAVGDRRLVLLEHRGLLERLEVATEGNRSVGFYGESQCGKSNLISRVGFSLGARQAEGNGSLLVCDPRPAGSRTGAPWDASGQPGIDFAEWLNPTNKDESTGVLCRFTMSGPEPARPGCFVARVMSHGDVLVSLALGHLDGIDPAAAPVDVPAHLKALDAEVRVEPDPEGFMGALLEAWRFLRRHRLPQDGAVEGLATTPGAHPRLRAMHEAGWEARARKWFLAGQRPVWDPSDLRGSPFARFAGVLWNCEPEMDYVYRRLLEALQRIGFAGELSLEAEDVCKCSGQASLLDVGHVNGLFNPADALRVSFHRGGGAVASETLDRSVVAALIRELVLPLEPSQPGAGMPIDVLDFPGARPPERNKGFSVATDRRRLACETFKRGKLNRLFLTSVELWDASALCLVVNAAGTLDCGAVIQEALGAWLEREGWQSTRSRAELPALSFEPQPPAVDPPLVVAIGRSDELLDDRATAPFGAPLKKIEGSLCDRIPWMQDWSTSGPFHRVHWVHNPEAIRGQDARPASMAGDRRGEFKRKCLHDPLVRRYVEDADARFDALFSSPQDVNLLFEQIVSVTQGVDRGGRVLGSVLRELEELEELVHREYSGDANEELVREEQAAALADVSFLEAALAMNLNPVAHILRALQVTPADVQAACRAAALRTSAAHAVEIGILRFEDFFQEMLQGFALRLDERLRHAHPFGAQGEQAEARLRSLRQHFSELPARRWFRDRLHQEVGAMFDRDAAALARSPMLAAIVSTHWNRRIVWLDGDPPATDIRPPQHPKRQQKNASSAKILQHWKARLPDLYKELVDSTDAARPSNQQLGILREGLRGALEGFRQSAAGYLAGPRGGALSARIRGLEHRLGATEDVPADAQPSAAEPSDAAPST